ncbi:PH domain-containing protein [Chloropicon primus]|uniref:PH domain-containing protein n=1 Tax=Chloropicon primus TaxID=1764295 RepID=A0A5B8MGC7_9CHLO|nr:hypothetical protein A3770_02p19650 [Chloropicon primus]UPQ98656.1 PH domain-containing protein [Chloropicon primus]|eukprot:QDZ19447.1 hypothetical protein A3770_02p19650 [Chloropicon primus]
MFKNIGRRNPAISAPPEVDWSADALQGRRRSSGEEGDDEEYKGRTTVRRLKDGMRKSFTSVVDPNTRGQRHARVQLEVDLHHVPLSSMRNEIPFANKKGWLWKARMKGDRWLRRYFILQGQLVVYFVNENDSKPKGSFLLHSYAQVDYTNEKINGRIFNFDVDTPERTYYLSAETQEEAKEWGQAMADACGESHRSLYAGEKLESNDEGRKEAQGQAESDAEENLIKMQQELSKVLIEMDDRVNAAVEKERQAQANNIQNAVSVEVASMREDFANARDQLVQWQHLSENLIQLISGHELALRFPDEKDKLARMKENYQNLSALLQSFAN